MFFLLVVVVVVDGTSEVSSPSVAMLVASALIECDLCAGVTIYAKKNELSTHKHKHKEQKQKCDSHQ